MPVDSQDCYTFGKEILLPVVEVVNKKIFDNENCENEVSGCENSIQELKSVEDLHATSKY